MTSLRPDLLLIAWRFQWAIIAGMVQRHNLETTEGQRKWEEVCTIEPWGEWVLINDELIPFFGKRTAGSTWVGYSNGPKVHTLDQLAGWITRIHGRDSLTSQQFNQYWDEYEKTYPELKDGRYKEGIT